MQLILLAALLILGGLLSYFLYGRRPGETAAPKVEATASKDQPAVAANEPTREQCLQAVERARALAQSLPEGHLSRYFVERHLQQSMAEAGNGEYDDCLYWAERATEETQNRQHELQPGESLKVLRSDETPQASSQSAPSADAAAPEGKKAKRKKK
jgi:hypothetical protein